MNATTGILDWPAVVGGLAAICSTLSFAPQAWKIIRTRDTGSISRKMYILTVTGFALWSFYGLMIGKWPIVASNLICLGLAAFILVMTFLRPGKSRDD